MSSIHFSDWDSYLYKGLDDDVLINIPGIKDNNKLSMYEHTASNLSLSKMANDRSIIPRTYNIEHLKNIHYELFHMTYAWAGHFRTVNITKDNSVFANIDGELDRHLNDAMNLVRTTNWKSEDKNIFSSNIARIFSRINYAHPFREGNGRTTRTFLNHVSELSPFKIDLSSISHDLWIRASEKSLPDRNGQYRDLNLITSVFRSSLKLRINEYREKPSRVRLIDMHLENQRNNTLER